MECPRCLSSNIKKRVPMITRKFIADERCHGYYGHLSKREIEVDVGLVFPKKPNFAQIYFDVCKDCGTIIDQYIKVNGDFAGRN